MDKMKKKAPPKAKPKVAAAVNPVAEMRKNFKKDVEKKLKAFIEQDSNELLFDDPAYAEDDVLRHIIHETAEDMGFTTKALGDEKRGERASVMVYKEEPEEEEVVQAEANFGQKEALKELQIEPKSLSARGKLLAGSAADQIAKRQEGNEFTKVEHD